MTKSSFKNMLWVVAKRVALTLGCSLVLLSCAIEEEFEVGEFDAISNWTEGDLFLDYNGAITNGFVIPSVNQTDDGKFVGAFDIKNLGGIPQKFYYKVYYQNKTYKFDEWALDGGDTIQNPLCLENFYGSWDDYTVGFLPTKMIPPDDQARTIDFSFQIIGNPRNERIYHGELKENNHISKERINAVKDMIRNDPKWFSDESARAIERGNDIEKQLKEAALYYIRSRKTQDYGNNRWQRNPRVGKYEFMLVVATEEAMNSNQIPSYIDRITRKNDSVYVNPFYYFKHGDGKSLPGVSVYHSKKLLSVKAKPNLNSGYYLDKELFDVKEFDENCFRDNCSSYDDMFENAAFQQFVHYIDPNISYDNIPVTADVLAGEYKLKDHEEAYDKYPPESRLKRGARITQCPCETIESKDDKLTLKNPGNEGKTPNEFAKENVGIMTRHGLTYGKYYVKVKLSEMLGPDNMWTGITNAIWLLYQDKAEWNQRRPCNNLGYIPKPEARGPEAVRHRILNYSEIDFEIIKTGKYWPASSYNGAGRKAPKREAEDPGDLIVACTNWDMACADPINYGQGAWDILFKDLKFETNRWDRFYKALTMKTPASEKELFESDYYYFVLEWSPKEIIWRIGPEKDQLRVVGYMNDQVTSVPNNQMLLLVTQEFHDTEWWPECDFSQGKIPYPKSDLVGQILSIEVE